MMGVWLGGGTCSRSASEGRCTSHSGKGDGGMGMGGGSEATEGELAKRVRRG